MAGESPRDEKPTDWSVLTANQRLEIASKIRFALMSLAISDAIPQWKSPEQLPHWQLVVESSWCDNKSAGTVAAARERAIQLAKIYVPLNGFVLKSPPKK